MRESEGALGRDGRALHSEAQRGTARDSEGEGGRAGKSEGVRWRARESVRVIGNAMDCEGEYIGRGWAGGGGGGGGRAKE